MEQELVETTETEMELQTTVTQVAEGVGAVTDAVTEQTQSKWPTQSMQTARESDGTIVAGAANTGSKLQSSRKRPHQDITNTDSTHHDARHEENTRRTLQRWHVRGGAEQDGAPRTGTTVSMSDHVHQTVYRMNSNVYAARVNESMDGMFTRKDVKKGDILCSYTGMQISGDAADPHDTQYLMHMMRRRRPEDKEETTVTVDGKGELGGYANYAGGRAANAVVSDVIRTVQAMKGDAGSGLSTAMIVVAAVDIPAGREVRWDYDYTAGRPFRAAMMARGITAEELDSTDYADVVWTVANSAVMPQKEMEFPYAAISELGLTIKTVRGREVVTEARHGGRKRRREDPAGCVDGIPEATDAPT